jgi:AhpD family alkylhydroperoxidase
MHQLRPGLHVVRRDDHHLQVGLDPPWRLVVPDEPDVRRLLAELAAGRPQTPETPAAHRVLRALLAADMLVDPGAVSASAQARSAAVVSVEASGQCEVDAIRLLRVSGCRVGPPEAATVALVLTDGEPRRDVVDSHVRDGRPHLVVAATPHGYVLGPFVVAGVTACLRCVDAHRGALDPRRAVVVEQLAGRELGLRDPALAATTTAWAVRDALAFVDGEQPSTWSATFELGPGREPRRLTWSRHPHCGCSWTLGLTETVPAAG